MNLGDFMKLINVLTSFLWVCLSGDTNINISQICDYSKHVRPGTLFICVEGTVFDGHNAIEEAIDKGAVAIIVGRPKVYELYKQKKKNKADLITWIYTKNTREATALTAAAFYDFPAEKLLCVGITGTKGKTTTSYMTKKILETAGYKTGLIGTVEIFNGKDSIPAIHTTPDAIDIQRYLAEMVHNQVKAVVMEVSSQGLKQCRTAGILFDVAVLTNIYKDHIGPLEHENMKEYMVCKSLLFKQCRRAVVNGHQKETLEVVKDANCPLKLFNLDQCMTQAGPRFSASDGYSFIIKTNMLGQFNLENALAAATTTDVLGIDGKYIEEGMKNIYVPGRTECLPIFKDFTVMIDYAHNAPALEKLLKELRNICQGRLVCMFGCGGNRDRNRRFEMGKISGMLADLTVVTTDNPRYESPEEIIMDIVKGIKKTGGNYITITDRKQAIDYCITHGRPNDLIVLAGKGHEGYQEIKGNRLPFDEKMYILQRYR